MGDGGCCCLSCWGGGTITGAKDEHGNSMLLLTVNKTVLKICIFHC